MASTEGAWFPMDELLGKLNVAIPGEILPNLLDGLRTWIPTMVGLRLLFADVEERALVVWGEAAHLAERRTERVAIDGSVHGRAYVSGASTWTEVDGERALVVPVTARAERIGVLEVRFSAGPDEAAESLLRTVGLVLGYVAVAGDRWSDVFHVARRRRNMDIAAEIQWNSLPISAFSSSRLLLAGALEPAYEIAGDMFDYSCGRHELVAGIFDAMGHGLTAARLSDLAVECFRNARRSGHDLLDQARRIHHTLLPGFAREGFVTGQLLSIDLEDPSRSRLVNAGHPAPFLQRGQDPPRPLEIEIDLPFGTPFENEFRVQPLVLRPEDRLVLLSDGTTEARPDGGPPFGEDRLVDQLVETRNLSPREAARRIIHAVRTHRAADLLDDVTLLVIDVL